MAERVEYNKAAKILEQRILKRIKDLGPKSPRLRETLKNIGALVERETKKNIQRKSKRANGEFKGLIDTGSLLNSIRYELFSQADASGVRVGSFGIPYAAVHEFGFSGNQSVPEHQRVMKKAFGKPIDPRFVTVRAHTRFMRIPARPFLSKAVKDKDVRRKIFLEIVRGLAVGN